MDKDTTYIEDYLHGKLSDKESKAFLSRLEADEAFKKQFEFEKQLLDTLNEDSWSYADKNDPEVQAYKSALRSKEVSAFKESIGKVSKSYTDNSTQQGKSKTLIYYVAAAVIAAFIAFQFMFNQPQSGEELYYSYIAMDDLPGFVTRNESTQTDAFKAEALFKQKDYDASIPLFQNLLASNKNDARPYLYLGIAQAEIENYEQAIAVFDELISSDLLDAEKGLWYKALTYLKMKEKKKALELLHKIQTESLYNAEKAGELIAEIE